MSLFLPDFFDPGNEPTDTKPEASHSKKMSEILPEGFFDDPKMDAKVRFRQTFKFRVPTRLGNREKVGNFVTGREVGKNKTP